MLRLPHPVRRYLAGPVTERDGFTLDVDAQLLLRLSSRMAQQPRESAERLRERTRSAAALAAGRPIDIAAVRDITVTGATGPLRARVYDPGDTDGLLVYFHGGGWVFGDVETHDATCRLLAAGSHMQIVSVDYRLAPEHPYPAAVDDAIAAYTDISCRATQFGVRPERVGVGGDSAGAYLAALVSAQPPAPGRARPLLQLLIYPPTDLSGASASRVSLAEGFPLNRSDIDYFDACFFPPELDRTHPQVSPLHAPSAAALPPAVIVTAGFDPLRDEGDAYAAKLAADGVPVTHRRFDGYTHGFVSTPVVFARAITEVAGLLGDCAAQTRNSSETA